MIAKAHPPPLLARTGFAPFQEHQKLFWSLGLAATKLRPPSTTHPKFFFFSFSSKHSRPHTNQVPKNFQILGLCFWFKNFGCHKYFSPWFSKISPFFLGCTVFVKKNGHSLVIFSQFLGDKVAPPITYL